MPLMYNYESFVIESYEFYVMYWRNDKKVNFFSFPLNNTFAAELGEAWQNTQVCCMFHTSSLKLSCLITFSVGDDLSLL